MLDFAPASYWPMAAIATTPQALKTLHPLIQSSLPVWIPPSLQQHGASITGNNSTGNNSTGSNSSSIQTYPGALSDHLATLWPNHRAFVFCLAAGATTRLIAPLLQNKATDPAVIVVDESGQYVISLCGGHQGGADQLAHLVAAQLGATPIITGASAQNNLPGIDILGKPFGWTKGRGNWTRVSAAIAQGKPLQVLQEAGSSLWQKHLPDDHPFQVGFSDTTATEPTEDDSEQNAGESIPPARIWISPTQRKFDPSSAKVQWHPRVLWVGIGCERGSSRQLIETAIARTCQASHFAEGAIAGLASLDLKADEAGLLELCHARDWPLHCFTADHLRDIPVPTPSDVVLAEVGTPSVSEAAAIAAATSATSGSQPPQLQVTKQIHRLEGEPGAVTVAIAQAPTEYTGRTGHLALVGIGPGALNQMTPAAKGAIAAVDAVIGYSLYIDLIRPLLRPGQIIEALPITQERARAERAIELANWGLSVAVISSGDSGIYGMAGLVMESLSQAGWDGESPSVQVYPGITALQAAAARVGTPLMHDFCAISLSDLLTPWDMIEKRLRAAAQADFVVALYNPKSKTRLTQIETAQSIFLAHRHPATPVALVQSAYRDTEKITITTLGALLDSPIDMLTTVLIGNASTLNHQDWLITPRGYLGFGQT